MGSKRDSKSRGTRTIQHGQLLRQERGEKSQSDLKPWQAITGLILAVEQFKLTVWMLAWDHEERKGGEKACCKREAPIEVQATAATLPEEPEVSSSERYSNRSLWDVHVVCASEDPGERRGLVELHLCDRDRMRVVSGDGSCWIVDVHLAECTRNKQVTTVVVFESCSQSKKTRDYLAGERGKRRVRKHAGPTAVHV
ncbi:hypothetical protein BJ508DRAFT_381361 [Ascobolus immersus RN42]|uniref:Uncharacterized protein n=1 Tax=Ascobolus immersus RN42 TaxID=1160509 RepID=A0A3N4HF92_ASCIM|nr:hypothetical protein BJ508DRAFT_381361 [Ascobolus immersus RN42]